MSTNTFPHKLSFRLLGPVILGVLVYLLVLMFFDSLSRLEENFFSREVLFTIILSLIFSELNRWVILWFEKLNLRIRARMLMQTFVGVLVSIIGISLSLFLYFTYVEGFTVIKTELITFNAIFSFFALFYHAYYFSLMYLDLKNEQKAATEIELQEKLSAELKAFKTDINPDLLYQGLEVILKSVPNDPVETDELVSALAAIYRYRLKHRDSELVPLADEINSIEQLIRLLSSLAPLDFSPDTSDRFFHLVPGTLLFVIERAIMNNIQGNPLEFVLSIDGDSLLVRYSHFPRLQLNMAYQKLPKRLQQSYRFYSNEEINEKFENGSCTILIPLITLENVTA